MKVRLGQFMITLDVDTSNPNLLELPLKEVLSSLGVLIKSGDSSNISAFSEENFREKINKKEDTQASAKDLVGVLRSAGITNKTIVSIAKGIFNQRNVTQQNLPRVISDIDKQAQGFLNRSIVDDYQSIYCGTVELRGERIKICIIGLNKQNQLTILALEEGTPDQVFQRTIKRGLNPKRVELGILSFHANAMEVFKDTFTKAVVQLDWNEYIELSTGAETKLRLKNAMSEPRARSVEKLIDQIDAPKELLTYLDFPKEIHRAIRTTNSIKRLEQDINARLRRPNITPEYKEMVLAWSVLRLQFQWFRTPVDSNQLSSLTYIKNPQAASLE